MKILISMLFVLVLGGCCHCRQCADKKCAKAQTPPQTTQEPVKAEVVPEQKRDEKGRFAK